ncbi:MAG TPA: restriction endonuclease subunit S [Candidatus Rifleibacterium sp.]|nr:restriction endonuclease subunit S [Candidatus Rifleibacterium sp.]
MSWPVFKLGEICKIISGSTPSRTKPELWNGAIHWITPKDLDESRILELDSSPETITDKGLKSCSTQILPVDSVLFSSRAPIGLVAVNKIPLCTNQGFKSLIPGENTHYKYLAYWLKANRQQLQAMGNGATFKELSKSVFEKVEIPLPPLPIQKKIAAVLDKASHRRQFSERSDGKRDQDRWW